MKIHIRRNILASVLILGLGVSLSGCSGNRTDIKIYEDGKISVSVDFSSKPTNLDEKYRALQAELDNLCDIFSRKEKSASDAIQPMGLSGIDIKFIAGIAFDFLKEMEDRTSLTVEGKCGGVIVNEDS